ncbi:Gfo/Idh/MocA family protein [Radiobacillus sp. PE A8.2]|uniref:Gfo/Idh/MocA family protein n=1 Tax=Radiobacillus sp. PE A8.2 TaxID=3380349 RepID=UPI00388DE9EA
MSKRLEIGLIGLDTSHVQKFTELLNDLENPNYVAGGKVTVAFPGGSEDFELSYSRIPKFTSLLSEDYGVNMLESPEEVAEKSDAIMINSVDGRVHLEQFKAVAPYKKPVFIDKPFTIDSSEAKQIIEIAEKYSTPLMSSSGLRYDETLTEALENNEKGEIIGADCYGPMQLESAQPGLFWYGIHTVEMLYTILGTGCQEVHAYTNEKHDFVTGVWDDGRIGTIRGNRAGNWEFGTSIHREKGTQTSNSKRSQKPFTPYLLEQIIEFMKTGVPNVHPYTTFEILTFIEAANESRKTRKPVKVKQL